MNTVLSAFLTQVVLCGALFFPARAQISAPGGPGKDAQWATAGKQAVGTSATLESKVWFTLAEGVMTEVYYPDVTVANVQSLQFILVDPETGAVETEMDDALHRIRVTRADSLSFRQINTAKNGKWRIVKQYAIDPERNTVMMLAYVLSRKERKVFVRFDPSIGNSGMGDVAETIPSSGARKLGGGVVVRDGGISASLLSAVDFDPKVTKTIDFVAHNAFLGEYDGLEMLRRKQPLNYFLKAGPGNVTQLLKASPQSFIGLKDIGEDLGGYNDGNKVALAYEYALGFGGTDAEAFANAKASLEKGFFTVRDEYEKQWSEYVKTLPQVGVKYQAQFNMAAMQLKSLEDKSKRGANIASLSIPWGGGANANENTVGGYHLVWARDLYQVFTAYMALGDKAAAERALDFLFNVQQRPDGSFPQNSWLDGRPYWTSLQMDEVAYPLIMAWQLGRFDKATYSNHVKKAADFIVKNGPATPQERWEEEAGYSPSTIAAEIAGLVCAAEIAKRNGDNASAELYLKTADEWEANVEKWTATKTGKYGDGNYYVRITQNGKPDAGEKIEINNGAGFFDEREIVDAGFLELVRLGIRRADDPLIVKSLKVVDQVIKIDTLNGPAFYRYNHDGYGEMDDGRRWNWDGKYTGKGRLWALLSGERAQYELALYNIYFPESVVKKISDSRPPDPISRRGSGILISSIYQSLDSMLGFANEGLMIPEQIWDRKETPKNIDRQFVPELKFGEGTGSATPLAWSMAQFIRLAVNLKQGRNLDTPSIVYERYAGKKK